MDTFKISEVLKLANENKMKFASLTSFEGDKIISWNNLKTTLPAHFKKIEARINSAITRPGYYKILLAENLHRTTAPDEFTIVKGKPEKIEVPTILNVPPERHYPAESLTLNDAIKLYSEISELKAKVLFLEQQNDLLQKNLTEAEAEIKELESQETSTLNDGIKSFGSMLKELAPGIMGGWEKSLELKERKLFLEEKKASVKKPYTGRVLNKTIVPGSQEHINKIEVLIENGSDEELTEELMKLKEVNADAFAKVCEVHEIDFEEETNPTE